MKIAPDDCQLCPALANCRTQVIHGAGYLGGIMVVGSSPHQWDDEKNEPFSGKEGTLLRHICQAAGIPTDKVYRTQAVKCRAPGDRPPKKVEVDACHTHLIAEIKAVKPKVILALGDAALQSLYGGDHSDTYEIDVVNWEHGKLLDIQEWEDNVTFWQSLDKAERLNSFPDGKPRKPKAALKPKKPKATKVGLKDVAGHTLTQPETGIPIVVSYHPRYIMRKRWHLVNIVVSHFKKARRMWDGTQAVGTLGDYAVIDTIDALEALRDYLLSDDVETIWFDCETTGLKWMDDEILCWQFAGCEGEGYTVPLLYNPGDGDHTNPLNGEVDLHPAWGDPADFRKLVSILREIFESPKPKGGHNVLFDRRMLERDSKQDFIAAVTGFAIKVNGRIIDTELHHVAVAESLPHNMTAVLANETDMPYYEEGVRDHKKNMARAPNQPVWEYGAADADGLPRMFKPLRARAEAEGTDWVLDNVTTPMLDVCRDIEERGFLVDMEHFKKLCLFYHDQQRIVEDELWACVHHKQPGWKYGYSPDLQKVLFEELNLPKSGRLTKAAKECADCPTGQCNKHDQTGADALKDIKRIMAEQGLTPHPVLDVLLRLKKITKMISTYLDGSNGQGGFTKYFRADGRIHPTMKVSRAETGRLASEAPNAQNMVNYLHIHPVGSTCSDAKCDQFFDFTHSIGYDKVIEILSGECSCPVHPDNQPATLIGSIGPAVSAALATLQSGIKIIPANSAGSTKSTTTPTASVSMLAPVSSTPLMNAVPTPAIGRLNASMASAEAITNLFSSSRAIAVLSAVRSRTTLSALITTTLQGVCADSYARDVIQPLVFSSILKGLYNAHSPTCQARERLTLQGDGAVYQLPEIDGENVYHDIVIAKPGYGIMNADWSQAEVWGLAYRLLKYTGDRTLLDVLESGVDIHLWMARKMYPTVDPNMEDGEWKNVHSWRRRRAKTCIFGIGYGLTAQGFALREGCTEEEAQATIDLYMAVVPGLPKLFAIVRWHLLKYGYIPNEFGRRRHIDILPLLQAMRERGEFEGLVREGINFPIQSSCSDLHSMASYQTFKSPVIAARKAGIILTVHDSLTFEFYYPNEQEAEKTAHLIKDLWQKVAWNTIKPDGEPLHWKIPVEVEWGNTWGTPLWKLDAHDRLKKLTKDVIAEEDKAVVWEENVDPITDQVISFEPTQIDRVA